MAAFICLAVGAAGTVSAAPEVPTCIVAMDNELTTAHVTAVIGETLDFTGAINVTTGTSSPRNLLIVAEITPSAWATQVSPTSENVSNHEVVRFNASVAVPPAALAANQGTLTIRASFLAIPGVQGSKVECAGTARILVAQYYRIDIDTTEPRVEVSAGPQGIEASIIVHNLGNGRDTFTLDLEEKPYLDQVRLFTNLPRRITMDPDQETTVTFTINASSDAKSGTYDVAVVMASDVQPQTARDSLVVTVTVKESLVESLIPDLTTGLILLAVAGGLIGVLLGRRAVKRKRAAREARKRLQQVLRQRREAGGAGEANASQEDGYAGDGGYDGDGGQYAEGGGETAAADDPGSDGGAYAPADNAGAAAVQAPSPAQERVRVRVKAPPKS